MSFTPQEIVTQLDRFIVGQDAAKRAVGVAVRNRWRRRQLDEPIAREVMPRNIIMMGPTGCGKTEIARRLADLTGAPFVKVEATKFTEVGYHGRDVETMVRDLLDQSINLVRREQAETVRAQAAADARQSVLDLLLPPAPRNYIDNEDDQQSSWQETRDALADQLDKGELDNRTVELTTTDKADSGALLSGLGLDQFGPEMAGAFERMMPSRSRQRKLTVKAALRLLEDEAVENRLDQDAIVSEAIRRAEEDGIVFIDEIDKIAMKSGKDGGPDVSRSGVQRDMLPIIEGCVVNTRYGPVSTDHILFIAAGAFHVASVDDLMPELQGRFPIRVELVALTRDDFVRILTEKEGSLPEQQKALLSAEGLNIDFSQDSIQAIADLSCKSNDEQENIGARRLITIVEKVFELLNYEADSMVASGQTTFDITEKYVRERVEGGPAGRRGWFKI